MQIRPSATIRQNYDEVSALCKKTQEPVYLTRHGEGDLVVMSIEAFVRREKMLRLREELMAVEEGRMRGDVGYSVEQVVGMMRAAAKETRHEG